MPSLNCAAVRSAEAGLRRCRSAGAAGYALAEAYSQAANDRKAAAGRRAMERIEAGEDPRRSIASMQAEWAAAAAEAVDHA